MVIRPHAGFLPEKSLHNRNNSGIRHSKKRPKKLQAIFSAGSVKIQRSHCWLQRKDEHASSAMDVLFI